MCILRFANQQADAGNRNIVFGNFTETRISWQNLAWVSFYQCFGSDVRPPDVAYIFISFVNVTHLNSLPKWHPKPDTVSNVKTKLKSNEKFKV